MSDSTPYYVLTGSDDALMVIKRPEIPGHPKAAFDDGKRVSFDVPPFDIVASGKDQGQVLDFVETTLPGLAVSERFRRALENAGVDNLEYFPVRIVDKRSKEKVYTDYFVANVVGLVACLDRAQSDLKMSKAANQILFIRNLQLDRSKLKGEKLFRLAEWSPLVLAHESVKRTVEKAGIRGVQFLPADGYHT